MIPYPPLEHIHVPTETQFPALSKLVAQTIRGSSITEEFIKQADCRHEIKIRQELRKQKSIYQFIHVFHRWIKVRLL